MIQARRRRNSDNSWSGLVAQGKAQVVLPTTDTGYKSYGAGRLFVSASGSCLSYPSGPYLSTVAGTVAGRVISIAASETGMIYALSQGAEPYLLHLGTIVRAKSEQSPVIIDSTHTFAAGAPRTFVHRWLSGATLDLTFDGHIESQVALQTTSVPTLVNIGNYDAGSLVPNAYIGPVAVCPARITDSETALLDVGLTAGWGGMELFRFFRDRGYSGTLVVPLEGDSRGYKVGA